MQVEFEIEEINQSRASRTREFIKVIVFEDKESLGAFWQTPKQFKKNIETYGESSYKNIEDFRGELKLHGAV